MRRRVARGEAQWHGEAACRWVRMWGRRPPGRVGADGRAIGDVPGLREWSWR